MADKSNPQVCYLLGSLNRGGAETLLLDIFKNSKENNLHLVGVYRKGGVLENDFKASGIPMTLLSFSKNLFSYVFRLRSFILKNNVQIVHAHQFIDAFYALFACLGTNIKIVLTTHGYDLSFSGLNDFLHRITLRQTDLNLYVSYYQKKYYAEKYRLNPDKQKVIYNGISFDKLLSAKNKSIRSELKLANDVLLLGMVGNFVPVRNQYFVCEFIESLNLAGVDSHFVFVGKRSDSNPELYDACVKKIQELHLDSNVSFLGSRSDVPDILEELDAFVYATDHDTFGIAVVEALAKGIPVFVNDWGVMTEITDNGRFATVYKTGNVNDLLDKFMIFKSDKKRFNDKALKASDYALTNFSIQHHISELKKIYKGLI